jgi:glycosyltransferase involved in cell wall biosynthesis
MLNNYIFKQQMSIRKKVAIISVYPPPFGGVSIHTKNLAEELVEKNMLSIFITNGDKKAEDPCYIKRITNNTIYNIDIFWYYKILLIGILYSKKTKIIHSHLGFSLVPFLFFHRFLFRKKIIHTIHNQWVKEQYDQLKKIPKSITNIFLKDRNTFWICVNENAYNQMLELGALKECISVIPAYIPTKKNKICSQNDLTIKQKIEDFKNGKKLIGVYGFRFSHDKNGQDIYGFNFSIEVFKQLIRTTPSLKLVILIPDASPAEKKEELLLKIKNEGLNENILPIFDNPIINMNIFWDQLDIYFRPTTDDGDSLAIREALSNGVKVVASNVCLRPNGTIIYKSLNINSAIDYLNEAINSIEKYGINDENYLTLLLDVYAKFGVKTNYTNLENDTKYTDNF